MWLMKKQTSLGNLGFPSLVHVKAGLLSDFWSISMSPYLVGGFNPSEKYESQMGLLFSIYGKIIQMFQTTNQVLVFSGLSRCPFLFTNLR